MLGADRSFEFARTLGVDMTTGRCLGGGAGGTDARLLLRPVGRLWLGVAGTRGLDICIMTEALSVCSSCRKYALGVLCP